MIAKFAKILRVTGVKTGVGVLIFDVNRSRIGVGFCNFGAGLESESQKSDSGHLCMSVTLPTSGCAHWLQLLRVGFGSRLEPIAFDINSG